MYGEIIMSVFIGLLTSAYVAFFIFRGKAPGLSMILIFSGFVGGWIGGMIWMFITGGLTYHILMAVPAVVTTALLCFFILTVFQIRVRERRLGKITSPLVIAGILVLLLISVLVVAVAPFQVSGYAVDASCQKNVGSYDGFIDITADVVCVNFPRITANPKPGDYVKFSIQFAVSNNSWEQPYIKLVVVQDVNGNGQWDEADTVWDNTDWKICTGDTGDDSMWRSNILYSGTDILQIHYKDNALPIYHSDVGQFSVVQDDSNAQCSNTPEGYTSPRDQISWQASGTVWQQQETVTGFYAIPVGSSSKIYGKLYCRTEYEGKNLLIIMAFDKRYQANPLVDSTPISEKVKAFTIGSSTPPDTNTEDIMQMLIDNWMWIAGGGVGLIVISSLARRRKPVVYYPPPQPQYHSPR